MPNRAHSPTALLMAVIRGSAIISSGKRYFDFFMSAALVSLPSRETHPLATSKCYDSSRRIQNVVRGGRVIYAVFAVDFQFRGPLDHSGGYVYELAVAA